MGLPIAAIATALLLVTGPVATLDGLAKSSTDVSTNPVGAHVVIGDGGGYVEIGRPPAGGGGGGAPACLRAWIPLGSLDVYKLPGAPGVGLVPPSPSPDAIAYLVYCGPQFLGVAWLTPSAFGANGQVPSAREIAEQLVRDLPYPPISIRLDPDGRGLTGLPTWGWIGGYDAPLTDSVAGLGTTVEVEATPGDASWNFGDGSAPVSGPVVTSGAPSATHVYEQRSPAGGDSVTVTITLTSRFRVDDGAWQPLDPVTRAASRTYRVVESRARLVPLP